MQSRGVAVVVLLALGLSACGTSSSSGSAGASAAACDSKNPFKVGAVLSITGASAEGAKQTSDGIDIATADLNAKKGILGRCVQVVYQDDQISATVASQVTRKLVDQDNVEFVIGVINSSIIPPVEQVTGEANKILVVGATDSIDYSKNPYVFRNEVTVAQIGEKYVDYMKNVLKLQRFGVLAVNNAYGIGVAGAVTSATAKARMTITRTEMFDPNALSLRTQVQQIRDSGAQALVTVVYGQAAIVALKAREEIGWTAPAFGSNGFATANIVQGVGSAGMQNLLVSPTYKRLNRGASSTDITDPRVISFRNKLEAKLGSSTMNDLIQQYVGGYDMLSLVANAYNAVGKTDASAVKSYLESHSYDGIKAAYHFTSNNHDGVPNDGVGMAVASSLKDGTLVSGE